MKITSAEVFVGGPGKNYVTLKIMTDQGIYGLGDGTLNTRETLPAEFLKTYMIPCLIGMGAPAMRHSGYAGRRICDGQR